jgi:hypothetical protein
MMGGAFEANANWFTRDTTNDDRPMITKTNETQTSATYQMRNGERVKVDHPVGYDATARDPEAQKWEYNGSSAYRGGLSGQVAVEDSMNDGDNAAFTVRPVRGAYNQFNASLRSGDMSQSDETRLNHAFNN